MADRWLMKVLGIGTTHIFPSPVWLESYDVDAEDGWGTSTLTTYRNRALRFPSPAAVLAAWKQPSTIRPLRLDGKPNRPVSMYTITPEEDAE